MHLRLTGENELELSRVGEPGLELAGDAAGEGFGAMQLLAGSLALCTAAVLSTYAANVAKVGIDGLRLRVSFSYAERPHRIGELDLVVTWPELPEERVDAARRAAVTCTIHRTLERSPEISTVVTRGA